MSRLMKTMSAGITVLLVMALVVPAAAFGWQGSTGAYAGGEATGTGGEPAGGGGSFGPVAATGTAGDPLRARVEAALQRRAQRFDQALQTMEQRRERIMELAGVVEQAGGDVAQVRAMLQQCEQLMEQAREQERTAAQMFRGVPDAGDRRGAFTQARVQARNAVATMSQARTQLREAAQLLRCIAEDLDEGTDV